MSVIGGCDGNDVSVESPQSQPATRAVPQPVAAESAQAGHYRGEASIGEPAHLYHVEALLTHDGDLMLHVGGPVDPGSLRSGAGVPIAAFAPAEAALFVGSVSFSGTQGSGHGVVIGERCAASNPGRFCGAPAAAEIGISRTGRMLTGEVHVATAQGVETWYLEIGDWSFYFALSASHGFGARMFRERLAPFAEPGGPIMTIDAVGRLFFQSGASGCVGNGTLTPHADGRFYVFDVDLVIESCDTEHAHLNGRFEGLATETQSGYWDYDSSLLMFLATPEGGARRFALTTLAEELWH